jgi:MAF protein
MRSDQFRPPIILASTSTTRRQLLARLNVPFDVISPEIDESPFERENAQTLSCRLAEQKAATVSTQFPHALVIGSDQVVWIESEPHVFIGKPLTASKAYEQLRMLSGKLVHFETAVNVQCQQLNINRTELIRFLVHFRTLSAIEIQRYVALDQPFYSAGSIKAENLGISLFEAMHGEDFTALMGLPLIKLSQMLREVGWQVP